MEYIVANIDEAPSSSAAGRSGHAGCSLTCGGPRSPAAPPRRAAAPSASRPPARGASPRAAAGSPGLTAGVSGSAPPGRRGWQPAPTRSRRAAARLQHGAGQRQHRAHPRPQLGGRLRRAARSWSRRRPPIAASSPSSCGPRLSCRPRMPSASPAVFGRRRASSISVASRTSHATGMSRRRASRSRHAAMATSAPSCPARSLPRPCTRRHAWSGSCTTAASRPEPPLHLLGAQLQPALPARAAPAEHRRRPADGARRRLRTRPASGSAGASTSR